MGTPQRLQHHTQAYHSRTRYPRAPQRKQNDGDSQGQESGLRHRHSISSGQEKAANCQGDTGAVHIGGSAQRDGKTAVECAESVHHRSCSSSCTDTSSLCLPAKLCSQRAQKHPKQQHEQILQEHHPARFLIVKEGKGDTEEEIIRHSVSQEQEQADACNAAGNCGNHRLLSVRQLPFRRQYRDVQPICSPMRTKAQCDMERCNLLAKETLAMP